MTLFATRRTYNAQTHRFTNNAAALTRYVLMTGGDGPVSKGGIISRADWHREVLRAADSREILLYVHGFNTSQSTMLQRQTALEQGLRRHGYRGAVVGFDWPSDGNVLAYDSDRNDAKKVAPYLVTEVIGLFLNETPRFTLHLLAHSMGAYLALRGFSGVGDAPGARKWGVDQVMFAAADVDVEWMRQGAWGSLVMDRRARRLTNYYNADDAVLQLSGDFINGGRSRAGRKGLPDLVAADQVDVDATRRYAAFPQKGAQISHRFYFEDDLFFRDVALTVAGTAAEAMPTRIVTNGDAVLLA
ncbi:hypothetical protein FIU94_02780 [Sulfitobacter sp. THAF37]|uniref:alpha/beta fold hydrolase n=1 Tax=Sulfitobacter sp. THAF37 TaxID=2587855 RepID=UPI00126926A8|nr:alpha/beta fold hydrolase [Sulfitobacter sp. THAF37]QFT57737.1 hypothetical protein FIU94_02780 [Sulfitobacter sp. THAF37]